MKPIKAIVAIAMIAVTATAKPVKSTGSSRDVSGPRCTINGVVRGNHGETVANTLIRIAGRRGGGGVSQVRTQADGTFELQRHSGVLHVVAEHRGVGRAVVNTNTFPGQVLTLELSLQKPGCWWGHTKFGLGTRHKT